MKLMKALVALLVAAGMMVPAVAVAEDRLSLSGEFRARGWYADGDFDGFDLGTETWADQRLRIAGKIAVAEGVSITFRTDITETNWGSGGSDFGAGRGGSTQQWDRAHMDLTKGNYHLRVGQQYIGMGKTYAVDTQEAGISLDYVGAMKVKAFALLDNDNGVSDKDAFIYGVSVTPMDNVQIFAAGQTDRTNMDEEAYVIGANGTFDLDAVKLVAEVDYFTGDANASQDAEGLQILVDASTALGAATVGLQGFYAQGSDDEVQYTGLGNGFGGWDPVFDVGTSLSNEQMDLGDNPVCDFLSACGGVFDWTGQGAGSIGARLYGNTALGATKVGASVAYLTTEEDDVVEGDVVALAAGLVYPVMDNTTFQVQLQYQDGEIDEVFGGSTNWDVDSFQAGTGFFVKF